MAWVRYEDQFYANAKVTAAVAEDPGALALHLLANAWTNTQRYPGYVPVHQPAILLCDRGLAQKWTDLLVRVGLWERWGELCAECVEEYAHLPEATGPGYVFHNASQYRAPAREKQTPGTPAELSAKRQAAGRKGGQTSAARRTGSKQAVRANAEASQANSQANEAKSDATAPPAAVPSESATVVDEEPNANPDTAGQIKQDVRANQANGASKNSKRSSNGVSPDPVPGSKNLPPTVGAAATQAALLEVDLPKPAPKAGGGVDRIVAAYVTGAAEAGLDSPSQELRARVGREAGRLLSKDKKPLELLVEAAAEMGAAGWNSLSVQLQRLSKRKADEASGASSGPRVNGSPGHDGRRVSTEEELRTGGRPHEILY